MNPRTVQIREIKMHKASKYEPTPEEIAEGTAKFRADWNDKTRRKRRGSKDKKDVDYVPVVGRFCKTLNGTYGLEMVEGMGVESGGS